MIIICSIHSKGDALKTTSLQLIRIIARVSSRPLMLQKFALQQHLSNEQNPGWLGYTGDYTTQLDRDYNKPL